MWRKEFTASYKYYTDVYTYRAQITKDEFYSNFNRQNLKDFKKTSLRKSERRVQRKTDN